MGNSDFLEWFLGAVGVERPNNLFGPFVDFPLEKLVFSFFLEHGVGIFEGSLVEVVLEASGLLLNDDSVYFLLTGRDFPQTPTQLTLLPMLHPARLRPDSLHIDVEQALHVRLSQRRGHFHWAPSQKCHLGPALVHPLFHINN